MLLGLRVLKGFLKRAPGRRLAPVGLEAVIIIIIIIIVAIMIILLIVIMIIILHQVVGGFAWNAWL